MNTKYITLDIRGQLEVPNFVKVTKGVDDLEEVSNNEIQELKRELPKFRFNSNETNRVPAGLDPSIT